MTYFPIVTIISIVIFCSLACLTKTAGCNVHGCLTCSSVSSYSCLVCSGGFTKVQDRCCYSDSISYCKACSRISGLCTSCQTGYPQQNTGKCSKLKCEIFGCENCSKSVNYCSKCKRGFSLISGACCYQEVLETCRLCSIKDGGCSQCSTTSKDYSL